MRTLTTLCAALALTLAATLPSHAQQPQGTPTGVCNDGSNWYGATKKGACSHHGGVKQWTGAPAGASSGTAAPAAPAAAPAAPASAPAPAPAATHAAAPAASGSAAAPAPGGGPGLVWVNTSSKVYHCYGARYYGTTKAGKYVTEAQAKTEGDRPDHGKPCS